MAAAVLVVATAKHLVRAVEENNLIRDPVRVEVGQGVGQVVKEALAAQVAGHGQMAIDARVDAHEVGQLKHEAGREVVDAVVAHILEGV